MGRSALVAALGWVALAASGLVAAPRAAAQGAASPVQRVLVVDLDDVGYDLLAATPTPNLDALAAAGRRLTRFYVSPVCSPTRAMFHTGAYGSHPDVLLGQVLAPMTWFELARRPLVPLPEAVSRAGRTTAKLGKWHLATTYLPTHPNELGWQHYAGAMGNLQALGNGFSRYEKVTNGVVSGGTTYVTTDETDDAIALVRGGVELVSLSYHAPHSPWHEPPAHLYTLPPPTTDYERAQVMLEACDHELGRLLAEAVPRGYTVVVFADNGTAQPIGGFKGTMFELGVCVPCFAIGPGVQPGVDEGLCGVVDLYATVLEWFGIPQAGPRMGPHSRSLAAQLAGAPGDRRWAYAERFRPNGLDPRRWASFWERTVVGERYKLVSDQLGARERLFDLWRDPAQAVDLLATPALEPEAASALAYLRDVLSRL